MAYSDFTLDRLIQEFGVEVQGMRSMFADASEVEPSAWLIESLQRANNTGFGSEKSRSERLVSPILLELSNRNQDAFAIISGANLDIDPGHGLNGECDFILSFTRLQDLVRAPIFCITEAKKQDVELGTAQCAAQLLGAMRLNKREKKVIPTLYGCSTTGVEWRFLRFEDNTFVLDETRYLISDLRKLLGVLQQVINWQLFAQHSKPLEGIYYSQTRLSSSDSGFSCFRFYRDGTFLSFIIGAGSQDFDSAENSKWMNHGHLLAQHQYHRYKAVNGELSLHFETIQGKRSQKHQTAGIINAAGQLEISPLENGKPMVYSKYQT